MVPWGYYALAVGIVALAPPALAQPCPGCTLGIFADEAMTSTTAPIAGTAMDLYVGLVFPLGVDAQFMGVEFSIAGLDPFEVTFTPRNNPAIVLGTPSMPVQIDSIYGTGGLDIAWGACRSGSTLLGVLHLTPRTAWPALPHVLQVRRRYPPSNAGQPYPLLVRCDDPYFTTARVAGGELTLTAEPDLFVNPRETRIPSAFDTGALDNNANQPAVVFQQDVHTANASWCRAYFSTVQLPPGSLLRVTSLEDGEVQELDRYTVRMWGNATAYFNGDTIRIELLAAPHTAGNRLVLDRVGVELTGGDCDNGPCLACTPDTRVPSSEDWSGRWVDGGCTASLYNKYGCYVSAGHCYTDPSTVFGFRIPASDPDCTMRQPLVADQFPVVTTEALLPTCVPDWRTGRIGVNSLGQTHYQRYGVFRAISTQAVTVNTGLDLYGFGSSCNPVRNGVQQHTTGVVSAVGSDKYVLNSGTVTGGTSGSAWLWNNKIVGINTCCGVTVSRIDQTTFAEARQQNTFSVQAPTNVPFCINQTSRTWGITVCNLSGAPDSYTWFAEGSPPPNGCTTPWPISLPGGGPTPVVPDGGCTTIYITMPKPTGFGTTGKTACYDITVTSVNSGVVIKQQGSVKARWDVCTAIAPGTGSGIGIAPFPGALLVGVGIRRPITFVVQNDGVSSGLIPYRIEPLSADLEPNGAIALNDNYFGVAATGIANIPLGSSAEITVDVRSRWADPFDTASLMLSTDVTGSGVYEPAISVPLRTTDETTAVLAEPDAQFFDRVFASPTPFETSTAIRFALAARADVDVRVFDVAGRQVRVLQSGPLDPGPHAITWDGRDSRGGRPGAGIYLVRMRAAGKEHRMKVVRVK